MSELRTYKILAVSLAIALLVPACGSSQQQESAISTAVAQTVQAQNPTETLSVPTSAPTSADQTDTPSPLASPAATATGASATLAPVEYCTASALLAGETVPDGTIIQPGTTFTKVWRVQNSGTCIWDSRWQLVFKGGDRLGGSFNYNLPLEAQPGQTVEVPIILQAPEDGGQHTGAWLLKSPWGKTFGVGQYSVPLSVSIVVGSGTPENHKTETVFGVTNVTYSVDRRCALANTFYTITANLTTNGPAKVIFTTMQSDGHMEKNHLINFTEATTKSFSWEWSQKKDSSQNPRSAGVIVNEPWYQEFAPVVLPDLCTFKQ